MRSCGDDGVPCSRGIAPRWLAPRAVLFVAMLAFWVLLAWPFAPGGEPHWDELVTGVLVAAVAALVVRELVTQDFARLVNPVRYLWAIAFLCVLGYYVVRANLDVAYRVLHPSLPIRPGIVRTRTRLRTDSARTALANAITLTPGTLTVDVAADGRFYVHWINVETEDDEQAARLILDRFEWFIGRIFE